MRAFPCALVFALIFIAGATPASFAAVFHGGSAYNVHESFVIMESEVYNFKEIRVHESVFWENRGTVFGDVAIIAGNRLLFQNAGTFHGRISVPESASLVQVVRAPEDIGLLDVSGGGGFSVMAEFADNVSFADLAGIARGADKLILKDSRLYFNIGDSADVPIEIAGQVVFMIHDVSGLDDLVLLRNVFGDGALFVSADVPKLFYAQTELKDGDIILHVHRETDYQKIIGGAKGGFVNAMRAAGANPRLLDRMDGAMSESELNAIMNSSVALNPVKLMAPLELFARFQSMGDISGEDGAIGGASAIFGNGISLYSAGVGGNIREGDLSLGASVFAGTLTASGMEEFGGRFYGADAAVEYRREFLRMAAGIGMAFAGFSTGPVFDGRAAAHNPDGFAGFGFAEIGARVWDDAVRIEPVARIRAFSARVLSAGESEASVGAGVRAAYAAGTMGVRTEYSAYGIMEKRGGQFGIRADVYSEADGAGFGIRIGVLDNDAGRFYEIGAEGIVRF